ncbi:MAG: type II toxin-antitoxin system HicB family antitoxin, partial [Clostridiales bacterium]|nr:type II toxin-antitoxin system HicB family antitoxin [Candidatus Blautia equi]
MKFIYPAVFHKAEDNMIHAHFPDLGKFEITGVTLEEAIENAHEALFDWITQEVSEDIIDLPPISDAEDLTVEDGDVIRDICVTIR